MSNVYIYNNSEAQGKQGLVVSTFRDKKLITSNEFAFAKKFNDPDEAKNWCLKHDITGVIFLRL